MTMMMVVVKMVMVVLRISYWRAIQYDASRHLPGCCSHVKAISKDKLITNKQSAPD